MSVDPESVPLPVSPLSEHSDSHSENTINIDEGTTDDICLKMENLISPSERKHMRDVKKDSCSLPEKKPEVANPEEDLSVAMKQCDEPEKKRHCAGGNACAS